MEQCNVSHVQKVVVAVSISNENLQLVHIYVLRVKSNERSIFHAEKNIVGPLIIEVISLFCVASFYIFAIDIIINFL